MKRLVSLFLIAAISGGVYWVRTQPAVSAEDRLAVRQLVVTCKTRKLGHGAVQACDRVLEQSSLKPGTRGDLLFHKAYALDTIRNDDAAVAAYTEAEPLTVNKRRWVWNNRGWIHVTAKRWEDVARDANLVLSDQPELRDGAYYGALILLRARAQAMGDKAAEHAIGLRYLQDTPVNHYALNRRIAYLKNPYRPFPEPDRSLTLLGDLTRAIAHRPDKSELYAMRVDALSQLGLVALAVKEMNRLGAIDAENPEQEPVITTEQVKKIYDELMVHWIIHGLGYEEIQKRISQPAKSADALWQRAKLKYLQGDVSGALADGRAALELGPNDAKDRSLVDMYERVERILSGTDLEFQG